MSKDSNDGMDALSKLIAMELFNSMTKPYPHSSTQASKSASANVGAKAAKELYDSYINVGFNEIQAFELLKLVLSN